MELNFEGVIVGAAALLVIGAFHPLVIWCEYRFTPVSYTHLDVYKRQAQLHPHIGEYQEASRRLEPVGDMVEENLKQDTYHHDNSEAEAVAGSDGPLVKAGQCKERQHNRRLGQQGFQAVSYTHLLAHHHPALCQKARIEGLQRTQGRAQMAGTVGRQRLSARHD